MLLNMTFKSTIHKIKQIGFDEIERFWIKKVTTNKEMSYTNGKYLQNKYGTIDLYMRLERKRIMG